MFNLGGLEFVKQMSRYNQDVSAQVRCCVSVLIT
jgi:hypothetical protein